MLLFGFLKNTGGNNVYLDFGSAAATTNFYLKPNEEIQFQLQQTQLNYICASGLTSTLSIIAGVGSWKRYSDFFIYNCNSKCCKYNYL